MDGVARDSAHCNPIPSDTRSEAMLGFAPARKAGPEHADRMSARSRQVQLGPFHT
jgi:hypothetical protein